MEDEAAVLRWGECFVYIIAMEGGPLKIGIAKNVERRRAQLQNANPLKLHIRATLRTNSWDALMTEQLAHWLLRAHRLQGEWFKVTAAEASVAVRQARQMVAQGQTLMVVKGDMADKERAAKKLSKPPRPPKEPKRDPLAAHRYPKA